ncbi:DivIVA domain-containing protein [Dyadobacter sp. CY261]|uniref:DivIVA domain-containing protein n=1 Tax=Dyadobacter sp. CY261 TaxID=2907203 RepID=UPI001F3C346D|nr:DivIVA domain-containing protein [Dyadobacter sp. CY261]MCF0074849.1 DivIVA domain-containing protein [Dyadobacter sp. CY261]
MKISAIEIRKHTFEKIFRGYDPDEVDAFLNSLSQEWERFSSENSLLKMQLEYAEKELAKLKDIESTLFRTLKAAEDTSKLIEKEAHEDAEKRIEESRNTANDLVAEAEQRTNQIIRQTEERLSKFKEEFANEVKVQERDFRAIENFRDNLIVQLSSLANSTLETVERFEQKYDKESVLNKMEEIKKHVAEIEIPKRPVFQQPVPIEIEESSAESEATVVLQDDKPEVVFEVAESQPEPEAVFEVDPELPELAEEKEEEVPAAVATSPVAALPEPEPVAEPEPVREESIRYNKPRETSKSAAEEAEEVLAEMHKVAEKARDSSAGINRARENSQPKKTGGSFFDQI